ncbi:MAG: hypothetical protein FJ390_02825 [Verrucomicrobia bacterium]|nr:hypothetical protein [Verrucomicrobiota bacterium]
MKNKITNRLVGFVTCWSIIIGLIYSARAQEAKSAGTSVVASSASQEDSKVMSVSDATSAEESKTPFSSQSKTPSTDSNRTNASSPDAEPSTNGIVPTDPSMIPPPASAENSTNAPLPMDPNAGGTAETLPEQASPVNSTESIEKKKHEIKVRYNEVRTQVEKEEAVVALRQAADKATTPEGQRQTLKAYYELLFKRMKQIDPSLSERCDVMQGAYLRRIEQNGVEPTIPLTLPATGSTNLTNAPTPPPSKGKLHKKNSTSNAAQ